MNGEDAASEFLESIAAAWSIPGGVVAVATRDEIVFERAFGVADIARDRPTTARDMFPIGSISKIGCAAVVLGLVDEGTLSLDDPIVRHLPWLTGALAGEQVTVERLLQHTAGLVSTVDAVADDLTQIAAYADRAVLMSPGRFHYSNLGFVLLGVACARITGRPYTELLRERVLEPAGMADSVSRITFAEFDRLARGYQARYDDRAWWPGAPLAEAPFLEVAGADGSIAATARDLTALGRVLINRGASVLPGETSARRVLSEDAFGAMTTRLASGGEDVLVLPGLPRVATSNYGLGVNVEISEDRVALSHGGGMVGFASFLLADLDRGLTVAVVTNADGTSPVAEAIARPLLELAAGSELHPLVRAGIDPHVWGANAVDRPRVADAEMLGEFRDQEGNALVVERDGDGMALEWDEARHPLLWSWSEAVLTPHPSAAPFPLSFEGGQWMCGSRVFERANGGSSEPVAASPTSPYAGHYRSYTPWFSNFRIVERGDRLVLVAPPGVEAPADELQLQELAEGEFACASRADGWVSPERYVFGPIIDGAAAWVDRDGCRYSRSFTP